MVSNSDAAGAAAFSFGAGYFRASRHECCGPAAFAILPRRVGFLDPPLSDLHDPFLMAGMADAAGGCAARSNSRRGYLLYGDYDVDGTSAVVILKKGIELLGGQASFHVPHRLRDGYGMRAEVVEEAAASGVSLIVSVDTGIRAGDVVRHARELGIDVIVTDHHLPEIESASGHRGAESQSAGLRVSG